MLDTAIGIPGTPLRIGLDAIVGLIPGAGDIIGAALSSYIVLAAVRSGVPAPVIWRMVANVGLDTLLGSIPVAGDIFDVVFKSNKKNVELLERVIAGDKQVAARSKWLGAAVLAGVFLFLAGIAYGAFVLVRLAWGLLTG